MKTIAVCTIAPNSALHLPCGVSCSNVRTKPVHITIEEFPNPDLSQQLEKAKQTIRQLRRVLEKSGIADDYDDEEGIDL